MASITKEIEIDANADEVWAALRDFGALHTRLVRGFVVDTQMDGGDARIVTFANGTTGRELLVGIDESQRRLAYAAVSERLQHHSASAQVFDAGGGRSRVVWTTDVLPDAMASYIDGQMTLGAEAMKATLEGRAPAAQPG